MAETMELTPQMNADFKLWEQEVAQNPAEQLGSLPQEGFTPEQHREVVDQIAAIGLPIDNLRKLVRRPNDTGSEGVLGSWDNGPENYGEFSVYELLDKQIPEMRLGTLVHEGAHANSPLRQENAHFYGGEEERAQAELYVHNLAGQSLITGKYMTGYHKHLAKQLDANEIPLGTFIEETQAIASELALTNRAKLAQVEAAQHAKIDKLRQAGLVTPDLKAVNLLSHPSESGEAEVDGIDKQMVALITGVSDYDSLIGHTTGLKARFYPAQTPEVPEQLPEQSTPSAYQTRQMSALAIRHSTGH